MACNISRSGWGVVRDMEKKNPQALGYIKTEVKTRRWEKKGGKDE